MSHRSSTPRSRPASARRSSSVPKNDGKITVYVYNVHSSDKLVLRVYPDLQLGPPSSTSESDERQQPPYNHGEDSGENRSQTSLKDEISRALGIQLQQIRLIYHGSALGDDEKTLRCYGIIDGETVHLRLLKIPCTGRNDVVLACAAKKCMEHAEWDKDEKLCMRPYALQTPAAQARLSHRCAKNGAALQPKWISQEHPKLFAPVGVAVDGHGGDTAYEEFNMKGVWVPPVDHPNQRGQNQYGLQRVRESIAANPSFFGGA